MADFEKDIEQAIADEIIPGCVLHAINRDGGSYHLCMKFANLFRIFQVRESLWKTLDAG
jgi:hypothetical protein